MSYPAIWLATATVGRHRCPQKRLQTARQPPVYPSSSPDHRACNSLTPFRCPHAVHPCPSVDSGLGDPPNVAARLSSLAGPGEILISKDTYVGAGLDSELEKRTVDLKGKSEPLAVRVLGDY